VKIFAFSFALCLRK